MGEFGNKEIMSKNIKYYMDACNVDRRVISEELNIPYTTFSDWVNGNKFPRIDKIEALAHYFGVNKSDLIEDKHKGGTYEKINYIKSIPVLGFCPGGPPMIAEESYNEYMPVTDATLDYALRVVGDSMVNARIQNGDVVLVDKHSDVINGDIVIALINKTEATIKRFYKYDDMIVLRPENNDMKEQQYKLDEIELLGKVKKVVYEL